MGIETPTPSLDEWQFKKVLGILRQERQAFLLTPFHKRVLRLLNVSVYLLFLILTCVVIYNIGIILLKLNKIGYIWISLITGLAILFFIIFFVLNLPLFYKILKQKLLMRRLGLTKSFGKEWHIRRRQKGLIRRLVNKIIVIVIYIFGIGSIIGGITAFQEEKSLGLLIFLEALGFALVTWPFLRLGKERLEFFAELTDLEDSLLGYKLRAEQTQAPGIEIPAEDLDRVARIEQSQITRERAEAIHTWKSQASEVREYASLKSRDLISAMGALELENRLRVEDQIERLSSEPHPPESQRDVNSDNWRLRIPDTSLELVYAVDDVQRQIQVIALQPLTNDAMPGPAPGGRAHA
jgi:hypothetical protein